VGFLEVNLCSVICTCEQLLHCSRIDRTRVGPCTCVSYCQLSNLGDLFFEFVLIDTKVFQCLRDIEFYIELIDLLDKAVDESLLRCSRKPHPAGDLSVALCCHRIFRVILDNVRKIDRICASVRDMSCGECCPCLVRHGVYDTKQRVGECHSCKALCVVHLLSCLHIAVVGSRQVIQDHLDRLERQRVCERPVQCGYIRLDRVCQSIHACVSHLFYREP